MRRNSDTESDQDDLFINIYIVQEQFQTRTVVRNFRSAGVDGALLAVCVYRRSLVDCSMDAYGVILLNE